MASRDELIVVEIVRKGTQKEKDAAWKYLRSIAARSEAEIINISDNTQNKIILAIGRLREKDLKSYNTQKLIAAINNILGKMISDCEILSRRMITANILAGKLKAIMKNRLRGDVLISAVMLNETDKARIDKMVRENIDNLKHGASLTLASVNAMIQKAAIRSNMPKVTPKTETKGKETKGQSGKPEKKEEKKDEAKPPKQDPISNEFEGMFIEPRKPSAFLLEKEPTKAELESIQKDPVSFAKQLSTANVRVVEGLRDEYAYRMAKNATAARAGKKAGEVAGIVTEMREQGVSAFTDKGGHKWSLINYCAMTTRTVATKSDNVGEVFADETHDLYYVVPHSHSCPICSKIEGKVYSRSGKDPRYPALASIFGKIDPAGTDDLDNTYMVIHPNCHHQIVKYIEPKKK